MKPSLPPYDPSMYQPPSSGLVGRAMGAPAQRPVAAPPAAQAATTPAAPQQPAARPPRKPAGMTLGQMDAARARRGQFNAR